MREGLSGWATRTDTGGGRSPQIFSQPEAGNCGKEVGRGVDVVKEGVRGRKYQMPKTMHQNNMVARAPKRLAGRYHQLKTGHCRTGQYLKWTKSSNTAECGWCRYKTQTRGHLFKNCDRWRPQQKIMLAAIRKKTGRGKNRFAIREMFADERCTGAVLDFLRTTKVGAMVGPRELPPEQTGEREGGDTRSP